MHDLNFWHALNDRGHYQSVSDKNKRDIQVFFPLPLWKTGINPVTYEERLKNSSVWKELRAVRNIKPAFHKYGLLGGMAYTGTKYTANCNRVEVQDLPSIKIPIICCQFCFNLLGLFYVLGRGNEPWTIKHDHTDHESIEAKEKYKPIEYPKPDGKLTFDILSSVALTGSIGCCYGSVIPR